MIDVPAAMSSTEATDHYQCPDQVQSMSRSQLLVLILTRRSATSPTLTPSHPSISPRSLRRGQARISCVTAVIVSS